MPGPTPAADTRSRQRDLTVQAIGITTAAWRSTRVPACIAASATRMPTVVSTASARAVVPAMPMATTTPGQQQRAQQDENDDEPQDPRTRELVGDEELGAARDQVEERLRHDERPQPRDMKPPESR